MDFANYLKHHYSDNIKISGEPHPPDGLAAMGAQVCSIVAMAAVFCGIFGGFIKDLLPGDAKTLVEYLTENPRFLVLTFFVCNFIGGQLIATGAFEVYVSDNLVYSKLETGQLPRPDALFPALQRQGLLRA
mmetsp:Transcript_90074/g.134996  ORF Transcript_90074/g.134996 Transcript_90074/m.134996 type:complete len:131 (+) Transcript_90074:204-596(+)